MNEILTRVAAPALLILVEVEGPIRISVLAQGAADEARVSQWIEANPALAELFAAALAAHEATGGAGRQREWARMLRADGGGIVAAFENLLAELHAAEARAAPHAGVGGRLTRRLRPFLRRG